MPKIYFLLRLRLDLESYRCQCSGTGYTGDRCQVEINECEVEDQCENGARCIDGINDYFCQCLPGYEGRHCEVFVIYFSFQLSLLLIPILVIKKQKWRFRAVCYPTK